MMEDGIEGFQLASFRAGATFLSASLTAPQHIFATAHEDIHGIIRRSSAFGALQRLYLSRVKEDCDILPVQIMAQNSRTSEEVAATYSTYLKFTSLGPEKPSAAIARDAIASNPEYRLYARIGEELVGKEYPLLSLIIIEAIAIFCWSSMALPFPQSIENQGDLKNLIPPTAFPDCRLQNLRKVWQPHHLAACQGEIEKFREFIEMPVPSVEQYLGLQEFVGERLLIIPPDSRAYAERKIYEIREAQVTAELLALDAVIDKLIEIFASDDLLACKSREEIAEYMEECQALEGQKIATGYDYPEYLETSRSPLRLVELEGVEQNQPRVVFIRSRASLESQFDVSRIQFPMQDLVAYHLWLEDRDDPYVHETAYVSFLDQDINSRFPVAVLASSYFSDLDLAFHLRHFQGRLWLICDIQPSELLRRLKTYIKEMRMEWVQPLSSMPGLGVMMALAVGNEEWLEGVLFPGNVLTMNSMLTSEAVRVYGEDLRGIGPTFHVYEEARKRRTIGRFISNLILKTENSFGYLGGINE